jgi:hypothetical protein
LGEVWDCEELPQRKAKDLTQSPQRKDGEKSEKYGELYRRDAECA